MMLSGYLPCSASDTVHVSGNVFRTVHLYDPVNLREIQSSCGHIRCKETCFTQSRSGAPVRINVITRLAQTLCTVFLFAEARIRSHTLQLLLLTVEMHHRKAGLEQPKRLVDISYLESPPPSIVSGPPRRKITTRASNLLAARKKHNHLMLGVGFQKREQGIELLMELAHKIVLL